jgi:hypothetical protein
MCKTSLPFSCLYILVSLWTKDQGYDYLRINMFTTFQLTSNFMNDIGKIIWNSCLYICTSTLHWRTNLFSMRNNYEGLFGEEIADHTNFCGFFCREPQQWYFFAPNTNVWGNDLHKTQILQLGVLTGN